MTAENRTLRIIHTKKQYFMQTKGSGFMHTKFCVITWNIVCLIIGYAGWARILEYCYGFATSMFPSVSLVFEIAVL